MEKDVKNSVSGMSGIVIKIPLLICMVGVSLVLPGQEARQPITLQLDQVAMKEVLDRIEQQSDLSFSYNSRLIDKQEAVSIHVDQVSLETALQTLFQERGINFEIVERQIVLKRARGARGGPQTPETGDTASVPMKNYTLSGYVRDAVTGEVLIGATITVPGKAAGTISNGYGFYSLTLQEEADSLLCTFVGYRTGTRPVNAMGNQTIGFDLEKEPSAILEVTVYSGEGENLVRTSRSSEERIDPESIRKMPALFGEKDVIKSLAAVPGIKFYGDGSTIFFVRGGSRDQNMITIDEAPLYNPTHLLGYFSTIIPDAIKDVKIYKGDFPANYGGRLSSLIDIRTKDGNMNHFGMDGSVGLLSSRLSLEGPLWKEHISFFASGRRSYIIRPIQNLNPNVRDLHFSDLHLKLNYHINSANRLFFSIYRGEDNFEARDPAAEATSGINWKNSTTSLRWNHLFSDRLFSNLTLLGSRYDYRLYTHKEENDYWNSRIDNLTLKYDFTHYVKPDYTLRFGLLAAAHFHDPGNMYMGGAEWDPGYDLSVRYTREYAMYISNQFILNNKVSIRAGLRVTAWQNMGPSTEYLVLQTSEGGIERDSLAVRVYPEGEVYHQTFSLEPRISLIWQAGESNVLKWSYSRTSQFQHLITNSISPFTSLEVWLPTGPNVPPQFAHQVTLGYTRRRNLPGLSLEVEAYYKRMNNLIDYRDHAHMLMNPLVEEELLFGTGNAYGVETILSKDQGRLTGWVSYTLSRAMYRVEGINGGEPFPAYSDRPHDFSLYLSWVVSPRVTLTGNFIYMTGAPFSTPTGFYYYEEHQVPIYAARNNDRLPPYHRLDLALNWRLSKPERRYQHELILSIYNFYNRINPVALHFNKTLDGDGNFVVPVDYYSNPKLYSTQYYLYGIVPSISYHFNF